MTCGLELGATLTANGVVYRIWAPEMSGMTASVRGIDGRERTIPLTKDQEGYHTGCDERGQAGDVYGYRIGSGPVLPDPASRAQQGDVHGRSVVVDPSAYAWQDGGWRRPVFRDLAIYELHVGTFTSEGTFRGVIGKLGYLRDLGVTAIQLMPIADFPGERNWGYDGVLIYAPAHCYGTPDDLRALVDAAHCHGLAVILDVVYNHFGPDGNYLSAYSPHYFNKRHHTPWGDGFNFDAEQNGPVRRFFARNPAYWMEEFHIDGFRFDATHEIQDDSARHILTELTEAVHARGGYAIAEDSRNERKVILPTAQGGLGFDAVWADDFHHSLRVSHTGERQGYYEDFRGTLEEMASILEHGWLYRGQETASRKSLRGTECQDLPPQAFLICISNHDQTGNRAFGERLSQLVPPAAYRAFSALLCLCPYTPMLFMGQEWASDTPFLYFTDHHDDLGRKVTEGRRREFAAFPEFASGKAAQIPDPQAEEVFRRSKLNWDEPTAEPHRGVLALYRDCLRLRREFGALRPKGRVEWRLGSIDEGVGRMMLKGEETDYMLLFDLQGGHRAAWGQGEEWDLVFSSEAARYGGEGVAEWQKGTAVFDGPEVLLLSTARTG